MTKAINWNFMEDMYDKITYDKLMEQFWLSTRMTVSKDKADWANLEPRERELFWQTFVGLTALDTLQSEDGVDALKKDAATQHEIAVLNNIQMMESEHARSYSSIFSTLNTKKEIEEIFAWAERNEYLNRKADMINEVYHSRGKHAHLKKKIASVFLESFLFYSGFYTPLYYLGKGKMINVAEVIKLIIRDESVHGVYIGYKFKRKYDALLVSERQEISDWAYNFLFDLYDNECRYTEELYDKMGWTEDVKVFLRYNANKALMNLGLAPLFNETADDVNPIVINGLSATTANHDFFSTIGNGYLLSVVEDMNDSDYDY